MKEPIRMHESHELPPALRDAFGALGRDAPSAEVAQRVQRALQALPAAAPGAAAVGTLSLSKLLVVTILIAGGVTSAVMLKSRREAPHAVEQASRTIAVSASPPPAPPSTRPSQLAPTVAAAQSPHVPAAVADPGVALAGTRAQGETLNTQSAIRARPTVSAKKPRADLSAQRAKGLLAPTVDARSSTRARVQDVGTPAQNVDAPQAEQATSESVDSAKSQGAQSSSPPLSASSTQASEAQRLAQCKRLAARDPEQALRQVEALAEDMPDGIFAQERELLAIRLHERLGHRDQAVELTRRFLERYPRSVYRRALAP